MAKRMKRAYLKRYSAAYIDVTRKPNTMIFDVDDRKIRFKPKLWECPGCADRAYLRFVCKRCSAPKKIVRALYVGHMVDKRTPVTRDAVIIQNDANVVKKAWQGATLQGVEQYVKSTILEYKDWSLKIYSSGDKAFLRQEDQNGISSSVQYTKQEALHLANHNRKKIIWIDYTSKS